MNTNQTIFTQGGAKMNKHFTEIKGIKGIDKLGKGDIVKVAALESLFEIKEIEGEYIALRSIKYKKLITQHYRYITKKANLNKARFYRKPASYEGIKRMMNYSKEYLPELEHYVIEEEWELTNDEMQEMKADFFDNYFERGEKGGYIEIEGKHARLCIKFYNSETGETIIVDPQGFRYCRYVAII